MKFEKYFQESNPISRTEYATLSFAVLIPAIWGQILFNDLAYLAE